MTNEPNPVRSGPEQSSEPGFSLAVGAVLLAPLALAWWAMMLWSTHEQIQAARIDIATTLAANALPVVVSAALVAGAAVGLTVANLLTRRGIAGVTIRFATTTGVGLALGLVGALVVNVGFAPSLARMVLAGTTAAAATIGGTLAAIRFPPAVGAVISATLTVFGVVLALSLFNDPLLSLFGAGNNQTSQLTAARWVARLASLTAGLVAGWAAFGYLRLARRRLTGDVLRWPVYLIGGAGPGLLLLVTEVIIRIGGGTLLESAGGLSDADGVAQRVLAGSRIDHAIGVLFVGALTALITFGRTLRSTSEDEPQATRDDSEYDKPQARHEDARYDEPQQHSDAGNESAASVSP